jgi:hypothetical protein
MTLAHQLGCTRLWRQPLSFPSHSTRQRSPHHRTSRRTTPHATTILATTADLLLGFVPPPACFDADCQSAKDAIFTAVVAAPILGLAVAILLALRPPSTDTSSGSQIFDSRDTGVYYEARDGVLPERDARGELAYKAISYTPWPVAEGEEGDRLRIPVGPVTNLELRTFVFTKTLRRESRLVTIRLPRPLGLVFEEDAAHKRVVLAAIVPGGSADSLARKAALDPALAAAAPAVGDVLRAVTATNLVYPTASLVFSARSPERHVVVYGADGQRWPKVATALKRGLVADGEVTLVLERRI